MSSSSSSHSGPHKSREEIRKKYLAACKAGGASSPDLESFVADLPEPDRSEVRSELEALGVSQSKRGATAKQADTIDDTSGQPSPGGTEEYVKAPGATVAPKATKVPPKAPDTIAGYDILGVLGRGAMGVVYKAKQQGLKRTVALKMILSGAHAGEHELARFRSEGEAVARLQHPNIVQIYAVGEAEGRPYFALEFVDGTTLDKEIRDNPLPPKKAAKTCKAMAEAMDYAHEQGIIHRDLKPANVLMTKDGTPKITDFGLAKRVEEDESGVTRAGTVLGTPSYMPPEQAEGRLADLSPRSDVYALGAVLYDLITGRAPFRGTSMLDTLEQVRTREPVQPAQLQPNVPKDLETICLKCLQKDPGRRYQSAAELADDLGRFLKGEPILARPIGSVERLWRWCKRNPGAAAVTAAIFLLIVGWATSSSALAFEANRQANNAENKRIEADNQKIEAEKQKEEAKRQEKIAIAKRTEAETERAKAERNEKTAKETAQVTVQQMITLGDSLYAKLKPKRVSGLADAEARTMRESVLATLRQSLGELSKKINLAGSSAFGEAGVNTELGDLLVRLGQSDEALKCFVLAQENLQAIVDKRPDFDQARGNLGIPILRRGDIAMDLKGDAHAAIESYTQARAIYQDLLDNPKDGSYVKGSRLKFKELQPKVHLSHVDLALGNAYLALGDPAKAREHYLKSRAYRQEWAEREGKSIEPRNWVMQAQMYVGIASSFLGDEKAMRDEFKVALASADSIVQQDPKSFNLKLYQGMVQGSYGDCLFRLGNTEEALDAYRDSHNNIAAFIAQAPADNTSQHPLLALSHERLALAHAKAGNTTESAQHFKDALKLRQDLQAIETNNLSRQAAFVLALARAGRHAEAAGFTTKIAKRMEQSTELQLQLVRCLAVCSVKDDKQRSPAMKLLKSALADAQFKNELLLRTDPELEPLRGEPQFQKLLEQVHGRAGAKK